MNKEYAVETILEDDLTTVKLELLQHDIIVASTRQEDREAMKILRSETTDPTFNGPSETFTDQHADIISSRAEQAPLINESVKLPSNLGFSPDMADEYDIHIDAIAFTKVVSNYETEMNSSHQ